MNNVREVERQIEDVNEWIETILVRQEKAQEEVSKARSDYVTATTKRQRLMGQLRNARKGQVA